MNKLLTIIFFSIAIISQYTFKNPINAQDLYSQQSETDPALEIFLNLPLLEGLLAEARQTGNKELEAHALLFIGKHYNIAHRNLEENINYFKQAVPIFEEIGDLCWQAQTLRDLAILYKVTGQITQAELHYQQALEAYQNTTKNCESS